MLGGQFEATNLSKMELEEYLKDIAEFVRKTWPIRAKLIPPRGEALTGMPIASESHMTPTICEHLDERKGEPTNLDSIN